MKTSREGERGKKERIAEAERMLSALHHRGDVIEIRVVSPKPAAGYFMDPHAAALAAVEYDRANKPAAIYFVMNELRAQLHERSPDTITPGLKPTATDADVGSDVAIARRSL